jgi:hypothetical protein
MKKQFLLATVLLVVAVTNAVAQKSKSFNSSSYTSAIGVKLFPDVDGSGGVGAVTFKHFFKENRAVEALGYFWNRGGRLTGLYEFHFDIPGATGLKWYVGPGAHVSFYNNRDRRYLNEAADGYTTVGVDGVLGLDYKFSNIPLNLSVDWQPAVEFGNGRYNGFASTFVGAAARYTF